MAAERLRQFATAAAAAAVSITRPNYFDTSKRGEIYELRGELNSDLQLEKKEAVKKVIASMTIGKDVSNLFTDVLKCVQTDDIELKKLVYLYLMNYAKSQPELDAEDPNPLIRALAIRTMGCLRVEKVLDYLCEPLKKALRDENAYVRKTAAICASKVFELSPELAEENGFVEMLREMLSDSNATVISNVITALADVQMRDPSLNVFRVDARIASRMLAVMNDCTEWGQISILDTLAQYQPESVEEIEHALEKVAPRLQHANVSLVMSAIKVILIYTDLLPEGHEMRPAMLKKLAPPLVTMLSSPPEIQYVILRNINIILQKHPDILAQGVRVFFCKFNDQLYVKLEKLEIIKLLVDVNNFEQVLAELNEYAKEVDVDFARKAISLMASCAIKVPQARERVFGSFEQLIATQVDFVLQEVAIALQTMLRSYPNAHLQSLPLLLERLDVFDDQESRAAIIWIIGEYGDRVENCTALLDSFLEGLSLEAIPVQSEILTATLKLFLKDMALFQGRLRAAISKGLACTESADLRERAILYGRIMEMDPQLVQSILGEHLQLGKPILQLLDETTLSLLLTQLSTIASVYHRPPDQLLATPYRQRSTIASPTLRKNNHNGVVGVAPIEPNLLDLDFENGTVSPQQQQQVFTELPVDLLDG